MGARDGMIRLERRDPARHSLGPVCFFGWGSIWDLPDQPDHQSSPAIFFLRAFTSGGVGARSIGAADGDALYFPGHGARDSRFLIFVFYRRRSVFNSQEIQFRGTVWSGLRF